MMGGASDAEVAKAAAAATATANDANRTNSFFKLKGLERMASSEDVVGDRPAGGDQAETLDREKEELDEGAGEGGVGQPSRVGQVDGGDADLHEEERRRRRG